MPFFQQKGVSTYNSFSLSLPLSLSLLSLSLSPVLSLRYTRTIYSTTLFHLLYSQEQSTSSLIFISSLPMLTLLIIIASIILPFSVSLLRTFTLSFLSPLSSCLPVNGCSIDACKCPVINDRQGRVNPSYPNGKNLFVF